jgi:hypothetical protein
VSQPPQFSSVKILSRVMPFGFLNRSTLLQRKTSCRLSVTERRMDCCSTSEKTWGEQLNLTEILTKQPQTREERASESRR